MRCADGLHNFHVPKSSSRPIPSLTALNKTLVLAFFVPINNPLVLPAPKPGKYQNTPCNWHFRPADCLSRTCVLHFYSSSFPRAWLG